MADILITVLVVLVAIFGGLSFIGFALMLGSLLNNAVTCLLNPPQKRRSRCRCR